MKRVYAPKEKATRKRNIKERRKKVLRFETGDKLRFEGWVVIC